MSFTHDHIAKKRHEAPKKGKDLGKVINILHRRIPGGIRSREVGQGREKFGCHESISPAAAEAKSSWPQQYAGSG